MSGPGFATGRDYRGKRPYSKQHFCQQHRLEELNCERPFWDNVQVYLDGQCLLLSYGSYGIAPITPVTKRRGRDEIYLLSAT